MEVFVLFASAFLLVLGSAQGKLLDISNFLYGRLFDTSPCSLSKSLVNEIKSYQSIANEIYEMATEKSFKGKSYKDLEVFSDSFQPRLSGSKALEKALDFILTKLRLDGRSNVHDETVKVPKVNR